LPVVGFYQGALLPADVPKNDITRLAAAGLIEPVPEEAGG
jgi:hypothetical protein